MPKPPRGRPPAGRPGQRKAVQEFNALFGEATPDTRTDAAGVRQVNPPPAGAGQAVRESGEWVEIELLDDSPFQPRLRLSHNKLASLVDSMNAQGQIQAAEARPHPTRRGRYQLSVGHRRKAAVKAGANAGIRKPNPHQYIGKLRVEIVPLTDEQMLDRAFAENEEREDFSVFDLANYYRMLREITPGTVPGQAPSWEGLVTIRKQERRPLPHSARHIRRIVEALELPEAVRERLAELNLGESEERPVTANEKHVRALRLLARPDQEELLAAIEAEKLSGNEALRRAEAKLAPPPDDVSRETTEATGGSSSDPSSGPATWTSPPPATPALTAMPASQGTGMAGGGATSRGHTSGVQGGAPAATDPDQAKRDDVADVLLAPALHFLAEAERLLPTIRMTDEYRRRVEERLAEVERRAGAVRKILEGKR